MKGLIGSALFMSAMLIFAGCDVYQKEKRPHIRYGKDRCITCGMIISEERFAAASDTADGHFAKFDSIGCLVLYRKKSQFPVERAWVHDGEGGEWMRARDAFFVKSQEIMTPMGDGLLAFKTRESAERFSMGKNAQVLSFEELK